MDALLIALFLSLIAESGGKLPRQFRALHRHYRGGVAVTAGMILAMAANMAIAAWAGGVIGAMLTPEARTLFWALALAGAGIGLLFAGSRSDRLERWPLGAFATSAAGLFLMGFGEGGAFLVAGIAAARADPWMAGAGGTIGGILACLAPSAIGEAVPEQAQKALRYGMAFLLLVMAFVAAVQGLRLA